MLNATQNKSQAINRLTALWALNESGLGGILHSAKFPFTGIFVGGFAVILIILIARYSAFSFRAILKATWLVLMIKAAVSPHSPFPAYLAVAFQGMCGAILFSANKNFKITSIVFGALALLESAVQKILLTVLFFGMSFWKSLDEFVVSTLTLVHLPSDFSFSEWIALSYVAVYLIIGVWIGEFASAIPDLIEGLDFSSIQLPDAKPITTKSKRKKRVVITIAISICFSLLLMNYFSQFKFGEVLIRVMLFTLLFYYVVSPLTTLLIKTFSKNKSSELQQLNSELVELRIAVKPVLIFVNLRYRGIEKYRMFVLYMVAIALNKFVVKEKIE
jgi:hypothetical protein